ncbi:hypothetical protein HO173_001610 [Letharia columbiana]|uniref:Uncharacterized protein n=1 Tax=Letharia columbiana TaxID=112416 RepID=A0A8H6G3U4_9LECA|nr:uncharacterized protein HO173_001610 [Letharia columbiana]KAF6240002.1 hypothetical protein HO173_001610 [Letharia columbiana]
MKGKRPILPDVNPQQRRERNKARATEVSQEASEMLGSNKAVSFDERYAKTILPMDSVSVVDFNDYFDDLQKWKEYRRVLYSGRTT